MATSGLIIMALNKPSHRGISKQFETRQIKKTYFARVFGTPSSAKGVIEQPLICDWPNRPMQKIDHENGKKACTHWELVDSDAVGSLIKLNPITGRSPQLRVHMLWLGHPILGDKLYAHEQARLLSKRMCLHASEISFTHPVTRQTMVFNSIHTF